MNRKSLLLLGLTLLAVVGLAMTFNDSGTSFLFKGSVAHQSFTTGSGIVTNNVGAQLAVGATTYFDALVASATNSVSGATAIAYCTNGTDLVDYVCIRWFFNGTGSDQTVSWPSGWKTNVYSAIPPAFTNNTITKVVLNVNGPTSSAALQTNCYVSFEYFK